MVERPVIPNRLAAMVNLDPDFKISCSLLRSSRWPDQYVYAPRPVNAVAPVDSQEKKHISETGGSEKTFVDGACAGIWTYPLLYTTDNHNLLVRGRGLFSEVLVAHLWPLDSRRFWQMGLGGCCLWPLLLNRVRSMVVMVVVLFWSSCTAQPVRDGVVKGPRISHKSKLNCNGYGRKRDSKGETGETQVLVGLLLQVSSPRSPSRVCCSLLRRLLLCFCKDQQATL